MVDIPEKEKRGQEVVSQIIVIIIIFFFVMNSCVCTPVGSTHCRQAEPTRRNAVPSKAVRIRKTKKAARLGAKAVPMLQPQKRTAVVQVI